MLDEIDRKFKGVQLLRITDFHNLKYCEAIIKEVACIFTVVNSLARCLERPEEIAGYQWPAGIMIRINADVIHNHKDYWDEPDKFNPDRWMTEGFEPKKN